MRRLTITILAATAAAAAAGAAYADGAKVDVAVSTHAANAHHVRVALTLAYEMQCGYPGPTPLVVTLPGTVPAQIATSAVLVNGKAARTVSVQGHRVTIAMPTRPKMMCDALGPGVLTVVLTTAAQVANPARPGHYQLRVTKGSMTTSAPLVVS